MSSLSTYEQLHQRPGSDVFTNWLLSPFRRGPKTSGLLPAATNPLVNALKVPDPAIGVPPNPTQLPLEPSMTGAGTNAVAPISPVSTTAPAAAVQPGVQGAYGGRPGIQTVIYRHQMEGGPAQREYIFNQDGLEIPGAGARMEDRLSYNQQLMDAMQGANSQNSPQFADLASQNNMFQKALSERMGSEAQMAEAGAKQSLADAETQKFSPEVLNKSAMLEAAKLNPALFNEPGYQKGLGLPTTMTGLGVDKATSLKEAYDALAARGIFNITEGTPEHAIVAGKFGNELRGGRPWKLSSSHLDPEILKRFVLPAAPAPAPKSLMAEPIQRIGVPRTARKRPAVFKGPPEPDVRFGNQPLIR